MRAISEEYTTNLTKAKMGKTLYFNETELLINKVITDKKDFDRIKHRDLLEKETPLWDMKYVYDPSFWKNYNILIDKPLDPTVQKDFGERSSALRPVYRCRREKLNNPEITCNKTLSPTC